MERTGRFMRRGGAEKLWEHLGWQGKKRYELRQDEG